MSAMDMFGPMMGLPQQPPAHFAGTQNYPIRRMQLEPMGLLQPNFQRMGFGGLAGPAQMGMQMLTQMLQQRTGMQMIAPGGGSAASFMRASKQQRDLEQLRSISSRQDFGRIRELVSPFVSAAYSNEDPAKVGALTNSITRDYARLANSPIGEMLGISDYLAPGGLSSGFSTRMYQAGMTSRRAPGRMGLNVDEVTGITNQMRAAMFTDGKENQGFTRGFNMREFGEMAQGMAQRGTLNITKNKGQMVTQFKEMAGALDALKDLMGTPDAPIPQLMQALDDMFGGGGLAGIPAAKLENMVRSAQTMGRTMGLSSQAMMQVMRGATLQAQGLGMEGELGAISALRAMPFSTAAQQLTEEQAAQPADGRIRLGMMSPKERMQRMQTAVLRTTNSEFTKRTAAMMKMRGMRAGGLSGSPELDKMEKIAQKIESGASPTVAEADWMRRSFQNGGFESIMTGAGFDARTTQDILRDKIGLQEEMANFDLSTTSMRAFRGQAVEQLGRRMEGSRLISMATGMDRMDSGADRAAAGRSFVEDMLEADRTPGGMRKRLEARFEGAEGQARMQRVIADFKSRGVTVDQGQVISMMGEQLRSTARNTLDRSILGDRQWEALQSGFSNRAIARQEEIKKGTAVQVAIDQSMSRAGFGNNKGGVGGMMQNFLRSIAEGGTNLEDIAMQTLGGAPSGQLLKAMNDPEVVKQYKEMQELTKAISAETKNMVGLKGEERKLAEATRAEKEKELSVIRENLGDLQAYLRPEQAAAAAAHGGRALSLEAVVSSGDKGEIAEILQSYAKKGLTGISVKGLSKKEAARYMQLQGEMKELARKALDPETSTAAGAAQALEDIAKKERELGVLQKKAGDRPIDVTKKSIAQARKVRDDAAKGTESTKIEQEKQKAVADEARAAPSPEDVASKQSGLGGKKKSTVLEGEMVSAAGTHITKLRMEVSNTDFVS